MSIATTQVPGVYRRRVGEVLVTALNDGALVLPAAYMLGITPANVESVLRAGGRRPPFHSPINAFLLQWPDRCVLVDTGAGGQMGGMGGGLPAALEAAGVESGEIGDIVMTHLHVDHMGGLLDAGGGAAFPAAQLWVAEPELAFWEDDAQKASSPEDRRPNFDLSRRCVAPYAGALHRFGYGEIMPGLEAIALPGHTPGHTGYMLASAGERLLIMGDVFHVHVVQAARPEVSMVFDTDPAQAARTRRDTLDRAIAEDLLVTGMHMSFPGFARIARAGDSYAVQPEVWQGTP